MRYVTVKKFSIESGYTEAAIRAKIADGTWEKDYVWRKAPDGRVLIDVSGYEEWVENAAGARLKKHSPSPILNVKDRITLSPPPFKP